MYIVFIILILLAAFLIILSVLAQNPKSGMAANFGASNQVMGVRQTSNFLEKFTWGTAIAILVLSVGATMFMPKSRISASKTGVEKAIEQTIDPNAVLPNQFANPDTNTDEVQPFGTETTTTTEPAATEAPVAAEAAAQESAQQ